MLKNIGIYSCMILILLLIVGFGAKAEVSAPENAKVLLEHEYSTYAAPPCLNPNIDYSSYEYALSTIRVANMLWEYTEDSECTHEVLNPKRSLIGLFIMEKVGILKPLSDRWNQDGTWNW